jgi:hypothetical protein
VLRCACVIPELAAADVEVLVAGAMDGFAGSVSVIAGGMKVAGAGGKILAGDTSVSIAVSATLSGIMVTGT